MKNIKLREYQEKAIENFKNNNYNGIFEMATGTGKTFTSLAASQNYYYYNDRLFLIILVPFNHLVTQWIENINIFYKKNILVCNNSKKSWIYNLESKIRDYNGKISDLEIVITTYKTASSEEFNYLISKVKRNSFIIADECHYFGMKSLKNHKLNNITCKLGLSATPDRWWDEKGSVFIRDYFNNTIFSYDMKMAIDNQNLTEYTYNFFPISLQTEEIEKYIKLTKRLFCLMNDKKSNYEEINRIVLQRTRIVSKAKNKKEKLIEHLKKLDVSKIKNTLIYCASGEIEEITKLVSGLGIKVHRFDSTLKNKERQKTLERFASGELQILTAMKCLDEGVDIPSTETAYFLASTTNPREFIQRRGRILRKYPNKQKAKIYDFIVIPNVDNFSVFKSIIIKEMPRFAEFSRFAYNQYLVREKMLKFLAKQKMEYLMDKLPWEVYREQLDLLEEYHENEQRN